MRRIPFSGHHTADLGSANNRHRLKLFRRFMGRETLKGVHALDVGAPNYISRQLMIEHNTRGDLNRGVRAPGRDYEIVTCFEVINHVMNALVLMEGIADLTRPGGRLYFSTPLLWLTTWYHGRGNFVEYKRRSMETLLEYCGFRILRYKVCNPWPWHFFFWGFRPPFRVMLNRFQLYECEKL